MRVALISSTFPPEGRGGAEAYVDTLACALAEEHDVLVLTGARHGVLSGSGRVAALPGLSPLPRSAATARKLLWHAQDQWLPRTFVAASRTLRQFRPDVVHTHECQGLSAAVFTAVERLNIPHVHTAHDLNLLCARVTMTKEGEFCGGRCHLCRIQRAVRGGAVRRHITRLLSVSDYIHRRHLEAGIVPPDRATVIRLGSAVPEVSEPRAASNGFHIGFLGSLAPHKGVKTLIEAFGRGDDPHWRLSIAGSGELEPHVLLAAAGDDRISYLGQVAGDDKEAFFATIDVLAVPSEWEEPAATVATEAIARGIPTIVSDRGGLPEIAEAFVFPSKDVASLHAALKRLADHPGEREEVTRRLRLRSEEFTWETHYRAVHEVLKSAAQSRTAAQ